MALRVWLRVVVLEALAGVQEPMEEESQQPGELWDSSAFTEAPLGLIPPTADLYHVRGGTRSRRSYSYMPKWLEIISCLSPAHPHNFSHLGTF